MTGAITYGAGPNDMIKLLAGTNPSTPVGGEAPNPIRFQVLDPDGVTPVAGASVFLNSIPAASFAVCGGAASCTTFSDGNGEVSTRATVLTAGTINITAQLAPASYSPPKQVQTVLSGISSPLDISLSSPTIWVAQDATLDLLLSVKVLVNGVGAPGHTVNFTVMQGMAILTATSAPTNANGLSTTTLRLQTLNAQVQVRASVGSQNTSCRIFNIFAVAHPRCV
jgi:hypothetical protein